MHRYIALSIGIVFVLLGLPGSVNVFHWELEEMGLPSLESQASRHDAVDLDAVMAGLREAHPERRKRWFLFMPGYERDYV